MKKLFLSLLVAILCIGQAKAAEPEVLFLETFSNVSGEIDSPTPLDVTKFDNQDGWTFDNSFAGPECIIIRQGGSVTLPAIPGLTGNAAFYLDIMPIDHEYFLKKSHTVSVNIGALSADYIESGVSVTLDYAMFDVTDESRLTIAADQGCDIMLSTARIYYGTRGGTTGSTRDDYLVKYSVAGGEYYKPFDVTIKTADIGGKIVVYTLDGSVPVRTSQRYTEGTPLTISETTTLTAAVIYGNGYFESGDPVTYTFPVSDEPEIPASTVELTVKTGSLKQQLMDLDVDFIEGLVLHGAINGADLAAICNQKGITSRLTYLNLKDVKFVYDDGVYISGTSAPEAGMGTTGTLVCHFSAENREETYYPSPTSSHTDLYSNNLACAFGGHPTLTRIELPDHMTSLGKNMLDNCKNLRMVILPSELRELEYASLNSPIELINLPESLEVIGDYALAGNKILGTINLPRLKYIGESAFRDSKIFDFEFGSELRYIGQGAFAGSLLERVDMPTPPDTIRSNTFDCDNLKEIIIGEGLRCLESYAFGYARPEVVSLPSTLIDIAPNALPDNYVSTIEPIDGIRYVGGVAYEVAEDREEYAIKDGTKALAQGLFSFRQVKKVTVPPSVYMIGNYAFSRSGLESVPEMKGVTEWPDGLFEGCSSLARVTVPEYITRLGNDVFADCQSLWQIKYNATDALSGNLFGQSAARPKSFDGIVIGEGVKRIPAGLFTSNWGVTEVVLPKSVERIDSAAFCSCNSLRSIQIPEKIVEIEPSTFASCEALESVVFPLGLERVGANAFWWCTSLKTVSIPEGTKVIEDDAFGVCRGVTTLYIPSTIEFMGSTAFSSVGYEAVKITCALPDPVTVNLGFYNDIVYIKVPNESVEDYKNHPNWSRFADVIIPIDEIAVSEESGSTSFGDLVDEDTDLSDTVVGNVYVTMSENDGYDESDGSLVLCTPMSEDEADAIGGMAPGKSDLANRYNGLVIMVPAGQGTVIVDCLTIGSLEVCVKIGENDPLSFTKSDKGEITVDYDVADDTYVYIYASATSGATRVVSRAVTDADNCVKIYSVGINPEPASINNVIDDSVPEITDYYTIEGRHVSSPTAPGVYIVRLGDGSTSKILIK